MSEARIRTEDLTIDEVNELYVETAMDRENIEALKSYQPLLLIGSRGTGKTMLMKKAESELTNEFSEKRILPVYTSFATCAIYENVNMLRLMVSKILISLRTKLKEQGIIVNGHIFRPIVNNNISPVVKKLEDYISDVSSNSYDTECEYSIDDDNIVNNIDYFRDFIQELCQEFNIKKIIIMFDEACQIFAPKQQREFFELFRALRSPIIICKAAVYPGLVSYGTFQQFHDATTKKIERGILSPDYIVKMREIVKKNYPNEYEKMITNGDLLNTIIYCSNGNPRFLLKSLNAVLDKSNTIKTSVVNDVIKEFYRVTIWTEHTKLDERYKGHKRMIEWSRNFIENVVANDITKINTKSDDSNGKTTVYFAISRKAPEVIKQAIKILEYSGVVTLDVEATKFRYEYYDRYQLNFGIVLLSMSATNLATACKEIIENISQKKFPNYGENSAAYEGASDLVIIDEEIDQKFFLDNVLNKKVDELEISRKLLKRLNDAGIILIKDIFEKDENELKKINYIGPVRSRQIYNDVMAAVIEYISG